ncbi:hypothetical protein NDU88_003362 [Pleurodeles waltl]|uniref:Uncharacterized protein n=1 Tax=Pleurodeles waltl TaxID=8319 RepID=A0AAV7KVD1_PLEWA|nr:hypothetical protein NDU88_003362 [Pleurodeles waltl]
MYSDTGPMSTTRQYHLCLAASPAFFQRAVKLHSSNKGKYPRSLGVHWHRWVTGSVPVLKNPVPQLVPNVGRYQLYRSKPEVRGELRVKILEEGRHFIDPCMSTWSESLCCEVPRFPTAMKDCCPGYRPDLDP